MHTLTFPQPISFHIDWRRTLLGGLAASVAMTAVVYFGPLLGIPNVDFASMLGSLVTGEPPAMFTPGWSAGLVVHLIIGSVIFSLIYAVVVRGLIPAHPILRGVAWSMGLWLLCQAMAMPIVGGGFFSGLTTDPTQVVIGSLVAHLVYGIVLGATVRDTRALKIADAPIMMEGQSHRAA